ncbi:MAG: TA system VapC family ribonuclease toxin [Acidobacteriota bacterium]
MMIVDANLLLYAYDAKSPHNRRAQRWMSEVLSGTEIVGLPWQSVAAFLRVASNPRLHGERPSIERLAVVVDSWFQQPNVRLLSPGERHWTLLRRMMVDGQAHGPQITDAQLAALTIECGGTLYSVDRDFGRFPGLRWVNPIA